MQIDITQDPARPERECRPAMLLQELLDAQRLPLFLDAASEIGVEGLGNCHAVACSLMADLIVVGRSEGWRWATGRTKHYTQHSWLEVDGWAVDTLTRHMVLFADVWWYRRTQHARDIRLRDAAATQRWLERYSRRAN